MLKYIFLSFLFLIPLTASRAEDVDFAYCSEYLEKVKKNAVMTGFSFPFDVDKDGKIVWENPQINKQDIDKTTREYSYTEVQPNGIRTTHTFTINMSEKGVIEEIQYDQNFHLTPRDRQFMPGMPDEAKSVVYFSTHKGKCFPSMSLVEQSFHDEYFSSTLFDTQLCYEINKFFKENKDVAQCFDNNSEKSKKMLQIFENNDYAQDKILAEHYRLVPQSANYGLSVEQRMLLSQPNAGPNIPGFSAQDRMDAFKVLGDSPLMAGNRILMDCYEKGLGSTINDNEIFEPQQFNPIQTITGSGPGETSTDSE